MKTLQLIKLTATVLIIIAAAAFAGCGEDPVAPVITVTGNPPASQTLEAAQTSAGSITFTTTAAWTSTVKAGEETATWIRITPASGDKAGEYTVSFALDANTSPEARTAIATFTCGQIEVAFSITQKGTAEKETATDKQITFTVRECNTEWSPYNGAQPFLTPTGTTITIYNKEGIEVASAETDAAGKAEITLPEGEYTYFATAPNGATNIGIPPSGRNTGPLITGMVTEKETSGPYLNLQPGNLTYADINGDGQINEQDFLQRAPLTVTAEAEETVHTATPAMLLYPQYLATLSNIMSKSAYIDLLRRHVSMDAALTHEATVDGYDVIQNFEYSASSDLVAYLWHAACNVITSANRLLDMTDRVYTDAGNYSQQTALQKQAAAVEARYQRASACHTLLTFFGGVPLTKAQWIGEMGTLDEPRSTEEETAQYIIEDCNYVVQYSVAGALEGTTQPPVTAAAAQQIAARAALHIGDCTSALNSLSAIINGGQYTLSNTWGADAISPPILTTGLSFKNNSNSPFYAARYTETLLLQTEAMLMAGNTESALTYLNQLLALQGLPPMTPANTREEILAAGIYTWRALLNLEGHTFAWMKRAGIFLTGMAEYGAAAKHQLLPIPQSEIDLNPNLTQNPGW